MDYVSFEFYLFLAAAVIVYYLVPLRFRWMVLLAADFYFFHVATTYRRELIVFIGIILVSWVLGIVQDWLRTDRDPEHDGVGSQAGGGFDRDTVSEAHGSREGEEEETTRVNGQGRIRTGLAGGMRGRLVRHRAIVLGVSVAAVLVPLLVTKYSFLLYGIEALLHKNHWGVLVSIGLSFFTLQIIAYLVDVYRGKVEAQKNPFKFALFISFFPQLLQGPIPRYDMLEPQLLTGHRFDERGFVKGFMLILWGFFLKLVIADKSGIVVDAIFAHYTAYQGAYALVGGVLYSLQLYADFLACTTLAQGISELFGIRLADNFHRPYFSTSIREFWGRWHISLSGWLRDYVYIPLGGNRKGKARKYVNLCITFLVSGVWHGTGWKYIVWGMMHAFYQIIGALTEGVRDKLYGLMGLAGGRRARVWIGRICTFFLVMLAWIVFRAETLGQGLFMIRSIFTVYNPWIFFNDALLELGLDWKEWLVLLTAVAVLFCVSRAQEKGIEIRERVLAQPMVLRWLVYFAAITVIMLFGSYGYGFDAADFIYGNF